MIFNLISNLDESAKVEHLHSYNHVIAWQLRNALQTAGHTVNLVRDTKLNNQPIPECDHSIVISNMAMTIIQKDIRYLERLRESTRNKLCLWLDSDLGDWTMFDFVLCVNLCHNRSPERFKYVGWATDPIRFYPRQTKPAVFIDPYMMGWYGGKCDHIYDTISNVFDDLTLSVFQPVEQYNHGRIPWVDIATQLSQCSYFIATQIANWGLVNLEAATCGALLVIHEDIDRPETFPSKLNYVTWKTREDLEKILKTPVDIQANRKLALENSWSKVTERIMENLK